MITSEKLVEAIEVERDEILVSLREIRKLKAGTQIRSVDTSLDLAIANLSNACEDLEMALKRIERPTRKEQWARNRAKQEEETKRVHESRTWANRQATQDAASMLPSDTTNVEILERVLLEAVRKAINTWTSDAASKATRNRRMGPVMVMLEEAYKRLVERD